MYKKIIKEKDTILGQYIAIMKTILENHKINFYKKLQQKNIWETELNETYSYFDKYIKLELYDLEILNEKEKLLFDLHHKMGFSYAEISKITGENISTLKQRNRRAKKKLEFVLGD